MSVDGGTSVSLCDCRREAVYTIFGFLFKVYKRFIAKPSALLRVECNHIMAVLTATHADHLTFLDQTIELCGLKHTDFHRLQKEKPLTS